MLNIKYVIMKKASLLTLVRFSFPTMKEGFPSLYIYRLNALYLYATRCSTRALITHG